jgi:DUF971 family protein/molybdopterin converting factor small subunit
MAPRWRLMEGAPMSEEISGPVPTEIRLDRTTRMLAVHFSDGAHFELPCEYLRVFSPAAEAKVARERGDWVIGKEGVNIERIAPVGNYAVQLIFDDGHDTGVYSWQTLYDLGVHQARNGGECQRHGQALGSSSGGVVRLLYFADLVETLGEASEEVQLPPGINDVAGLLAWLRDRGGRWARIPDEKRLTVTVNRQFAEPNTRIKASDEVAFTPADRS